MTGACMRVIIIIFVGVQVVIESPEEIVVQLQARRVSCPTCMPVGC